MSLGRFVGSPRSLAVAVTTITCLIFGLTTPVSATPPDSGCPTAVAPVQNSALEYLIATPAELMWIKQAISDGDSARLSASYIQTADLDFTGCTWFSTIADTVTFAGTYDGGGFSISDLTISASNSDNGVGIFGVVSFHGVLRNIHVRNVTLATTDSNAGLLVGALHGRLSRSSATGSITARGNVGGLVGNTLGVGFGNVGSVEESWADVTVTATPSTGAGGLVGMMVGGAIRRSFSSGSVSASSLGGGLVGTLASASITDSYATGSVTGTADAAGLVGISGTLTGQASASISNAYAVGAVTSSGFPGSFGLISAGAPTASANFWDTQTTGQSVAGPSASATGKTTAQMRVFTTFADAGWSITNGYSTATTWGICARFNNGYPFLTALQTTDVCSDAGGSNPETAVLTLNAGEAASCRASTLDGTRGTWIALPDGTTCSASPETPDATLLGWATTRDFPIEIAERQVNNGWGPYETFDADGRMTGVFIPAGSSTFLSRSNNLYAVWGS